MSAYTSSITYFEKPGKANTQETLKLARAKASETGISHVLVASTTGHTAKLAVDLLTDMDITIITHAAGYIEPDSQEFDIKVRDYATAKGAQVLTAQHTFAGVNRAIRKSLGGYQSDEIIAHVLRIFGQGMKVVCEIAMMAADAGFASSNEAVIAIAGTHRGADLGVILVPANSSRFFDIKILDIFCMPSHQHPQFRPKRN
jgi:uncharacterized protein